MTRIPLLALTVGVMVAACSRQEPRSEHVHSESPRPPVIAISVASAAASPVTAPATRSSAEGAVDLAFPKGCDEIYDPSDVCKTLRSLLDVHTRLENRACLSRIQHVIPGYGASCEWAPFSYKPPRGGVHEDCYSDRFDGEGVLCTIIDDRHPDDASSHYGATEKAVRACLQDWHYEQTAKTRAYVDRAFSVSKAADGADGRRVSHVQACRYTEAPHSIDEQSRHYVRLEVFTERQDRKPTSP
jgi:hypothetical protein